MGVTSNKKILIVEDEQDILQLVKHYLEKEGFRAIPAMNGIEALKKVKEDTVGDIAAEIGLSLKATSKHLGILHVADIVEKEQRGLLMFYRLSPDLHHLVKYISNSRE